MKEISSEAGFNGKRFLVCKYGDLGMRMLIEPQPMLSITDVSISLPAARTLSPSLQVHRRLDSTLADVRAALCRRLQWRFVVGCPCGRPCAAHRRADCPAADCVHTLPLNQCLSGDTVYCDFRRVSVEHVRRCFERRQLDRTTGTRDGPGERQTEELAGRVLSNLLSWSKLAVFRWITGP